ncbi:dual CXXC motif small (seleno)protein [uncultured Desulfovibrio sp.]|uniref:dual CXXC motif small (seleno)protein n=1 Tax=uncultured Desulfovibrio sp. TaxID=167968 RepID=UPI00261EF2DE|nr:dual CXXC motif small (seleno)protein [uncultured Desulfovibrio sp.]
MSYFAPRQAQTTLPCPHCGKPMLIVRTCHEAHMYCEHCRQSYDLARFITQADDAMETFLAGLYMDRI